MPRGIKTKTEEAKQAEEQTRKAELAKFLLQIVEDIDKGIADDILRLMRTQPASDIAVLQSDYKATGRVIRELKAMVNNGELATRYLETH